MTDHNSRSVNGSILKKLYLSCQEGLSSLKVGVKVSVSILLLLASAFVIFKSSLKETYAQQTNLKTCAEIAQGYDFYMCSTMTTTGFGCGPASDPERNNICYSKIQIAQSSDCLSQGKVCRYYNKQTCGTTNAECNQRCGIDGCAVAAQNPTPTPTRWPPLIWPTSIPAPSVTSVPVCSHKGTVGNCNSNCTPTCPVTFERCSVTDCAFGKGKSSACVLDFGGGKSIYQSVCCCPTVTIPKDPLFTPTPVPTIRHGGIGGCTLLGEPTCPEDYGKCDLCHCGLSLPSQTSCPKSGKYSICEYIVKGSWDPVKMDCCCPLGDLSSPKISPTKTPSYPPSTESKTVSFWSRFRDLLSF